MYFEFNQYSSLLLIGVLQGFIYAALLVNRGFREERKADYLMAGVLVTLALFVCQWMLGFAGWYDAKNGYATIMFYMEWTLPFLLGPLFYCYFLALTNSNFSLRKYWKHFIPALIHFSGDIFVALYDLIYNNYILGNGLPFFDGTRGPIQEAFNSNSYWWLSVIGQASRIHVIVYLILTILTFRKYKKYLISNFSNTENLRFAWFNSILFLLAISMIAFVLMNYIADIFGISYVEAWYFYFIVSVSIFVLSIQSQRQPIRELALLDFMPNVSTSIDSEKSTSPPELNEDLLLLKNKLEPYMLSARPYLNPELTIKKLASDLNTNTNYLSKVINASYQQNFNDYINQHRVRLFQDKLKQGAHKDFTLLSLALECGFNSKATFNRAFKKHSGMSPAEFAKGAAAPDSQA